MASPLPPEERARRHALYTQAYAVGDAATIRALYPEIGSKNGWIKFSNWCCQQGLATPKHYKTERRDNRMVVRKTERKAVPERRAGHTGPRRKSTLEAELRACDLLTPEADYETVVKVCRKVGASIQRVIGYRSNPENIEKLRRKLLEQG